MLNGKHIAYILLTLFSVQLALQNPVVKAAVLGDVLKLVEPLCFKKQQQKNSTREAQWEKAPQSPVVTVAVSCQQNFVIDNFQWAAIHNFKTTQRPVSKRLTLVSITLDQFLPPPKNDSLNLTLY